MRELKLQIQISVDGFIGELDWMTCGWDDDRKNFRALPPYWCNAERLAVIHRNSISCENLSVFVKINTLAKTKIFTLKTKKVISLHVLNF